jgi:hypothetical protein
MNKYCVTAANHNNEKDERASEFELWKWTQQEDKSWIWIRQGKKTLNHVAGLLAQGNEVISATAKKLDGGGYKITRGYPLELELRIAKNEKKFKITELPTF